VRRFSPFTLLLTGLCLVGLALPVQAADPSARDAVETSLPEPTDPDVRASLAGAASLQVLRPDDNRLNRPRSGRPRR
jgi:hypothetical protein